MEVSAKFQRGARQKGLRCGFKVRFRCGLDPPELHRNRNLATAVIAAYIATTCCLNRIRLNRSNPLRCPPAPAIPSSLLATRLSRCDLNRAGQIWLFTGVACSLLPLYHLAHPKDAPNGHSTRIRLVCIQERGLFNFYEEQPTQMELNPDPALVTARLGSCGHTQGWCPMVGEVRRQAKRIHGAVASTAARALRQ